MSVSPGQVDALRQLRERSRAEGDLFWLEEGHLAVFDPAAAQALNSRNFSDLALPDKLSDLLLRRQGKKVYWQTVREGWLAQTRRLLAAEELARLAARMAALLAERTGVRRDLMWLAQEVISRSLVPVVIDGLAPRELEKVWRDQDFKIRLTTGGAGASNFWRDSRNLWIQLRAGGAVRRELNGRATGRRPRRLDLTDPVVDLLPELGIGRAVDAVTGVLTAIGGPPGGAAACLIYALVKHPEWHRKVKEELRGLDLARLCAAPTRAAPVTHRVVRETLRLWSPTAIVGRPVRKQLEYQGHRLEPGQEYLLSPDLLHHDGRWWKDPDRFDPDRWGEVEKCPRAAAAYVPFGWQPRTCIGAGLGMAQLILFCRLLTVEHTLEVENPENLAMALPGMPIPQNLVGQVVKS